MRIPDLNLLLYAVNQDAPDHRAALRWWNEALSGVETIGLPWSVLLGFVRLTTSPIAVRAPLHPAEALGYLDRWLSREVTTIVEPTGRHVAILRDLLGPTGTGGNLVTDAHLAALAMEHGAELCTADRDFGRFPGLRWSNPLE